MENFYLSIKDKATLNKIIERITLECYEHAQAGNGSLLFSSKKMIDIIKDIFPKVNNIITIEELSLIEEELEKLGYYTYCDGISFYVSWKENEEKCE